MFSHSMWKCQQRTCCNYYTHTHMHTPPFYGPLDFVRDYPGKPVPEPIWILLKPGTVSGSGISIMEKTLIIKMQSVCLIRILFRYSRSLQNRTFGDSWNRSHQMPFMLCYQKSKYWKEYSSQVSSFCDVKPTMEGNNVCWIFDIIIQGMMVWDYKTIHNYTTDDTLKHAS